MTRWTQKDVDKLKSSKEMSKEKDFLKIGIDPDIDRSGVAIIEGVRLYCSNYSFCEILKFLEATKKTHLKHCVFIEAGWLVSHNFTAKKGLSLKRQLKIANDVGVNWGVGKLIEQFCIKENINYKLIKPLKKRWGKTGKEKISHAEFINLFKVKKLAPTLKSTNQEQRDAALLIL